MYRVTALMPMKGHSERVPNKNLTELSKKPLYTWCLNSLLSSKYIDSIIIDTDSENIKKSIEEIYPLETKIMVIDRPESLLGDFAIITDIIRHDMSHTKNEDILQTHATCPLLTTETIDRAVEKYFENKENGSFDSLLTVTRIQSRLYYSNGAPLNHKINVYKRSQDELPVYEENSNIFLFSKASLLANNGRIGNKPFFFEMDKLESVDIDEKQDLELAEALLALRK